MSNYRRLIDDNTYSVDDLQDIADAEFVKYDFVQDLCSSIENCVNGVIDDLKPIQGLTEIDGIMAQLKSLAEDLY